MNEAVIPDSTNIFTVNVPYVLLLTSLNFVLSTPAVTTVKKIFLGQHNINYVYVHVQMKDFLKYVVIIPLLVTWVE